jgi:hypothetical protein
MLTTPGVVNYVVSCALKLVTLTERSALAQPFYSKSANVASYDSALSRCQYRPR